jgi:thioesterase domain-containing protein
MPHVVIYTSTQACAPVLDLALALRAQGHQLRSLVYLPAPQPVRAASLRLELAALQQIERTTSWVLSQYAEHRRLPDPAREADLQADLDVTRWQIATVTATLNALKGEPSHE